MIFSYLCVLSLTLIFMQILGCGRCPDVKMVSSVVVFLAIVVCGNCLQDPAESSDAEVCVEGKGKGDCGCGGSLRESIVKRRGKTTDKQVERRMDVENELVPIPGGIFKMGLDKAILTQDGESPARLVEISDFLLDKYEVSNGEFSKFVYDTDYVTEAEKFSNSFVVEYFVSHKIQENITQAVANAPWWLPVDNASWRQPEGADSNIKDRMSHPVVHVSWNDAVSFCKWAGKRLPMEAEWEYACKSGLKDRLFPWGNNPTPTGEHWMNIWQGVFPTNNTLDDGYAGTAPVNTYRPNKSGLCNMVGNVWEWVNDWWTVNHSRENQKDPVGPHAGSDKVKKGGSFLCHKDYCYRYRCAARSQNTPDSSAHNLGFRCAKSI